MNHVASAALAISLLTSTPVLAQSAPPSQAQPKFVVGEGNKVFDAASAHGSYLFVHVLSGAASESNAKYLAEITAGIPTLAGAKHVFVQNASAEDYASTVAAAPTSTAPLVYRDAAGALASALSLTATYTSHGNAVPAPAVILFDTDGKEIYRRVSTSDTDRATFASLSRTLAALTKDKTTAESNLDSGLALQGYDPTAYRDQQKAIPGDKTIISMFRGITYRFSTISSRDTFNAEPAKYVPAYGGWCATAMADNRKVEIDPRNFKVTNGRVFLFYKGLLGNALNDWKKDEPSLTAKADANWSKLAPTR